MINRKIPENLNKSILRPLLGYKEDNTEKKYILKIENFERECENYLIDVLSKLDINASIKTDPYSLPYNKEIITILHGESYLNGPYEFKRVAKKIIKEILSTNLIKIRFYIYIEIESGGNSLVDAFGKIIYHFRYHEKTDA